MELDESLQLAQSCATLKYAFTPLNDENSLRKRHKGEAKEGDSHHQALVPLLKCMCTLLLRHETEISTQRKQDPFILFFVKEPTEPIGFLLKAGQTWQAEGKIQKVPVHRAYLIQQLFSDLQAKLVHLSKLGPSHATVQKMIQADLLLPDQAWPYKAWNPTKKCLLISDRKAIPFAKMLGALRASSGDGPGGDEHSEISSSR